MPEPKYDDVTKQLMDQVEQDDEPAVFPSSEESEDVSESEPIITPQDTDSDTREFNLDKELDDILSIEREDSAVVKEALATEHKLGKNAKTIMERDMTDDARKLYGNATKALGRAKNEIGDLRKQLAEKNKAYNQDISSHQDKTVLTELEKLAATDISKLDPYNPDELDKIIEVKMAKKELEKNGMYQNAVKKQEEEVARKQFIKDNPDIMKQEYKSALIDIYKRYDNISIEDAYRMAQGIVYEKERAIQAALKRNDVETLKKLGAGSNLTNTKLVRPNDWDRMTAREKIAWADDNNYKPHHQSV